MGVSNRYVVSCLTLFHTCTRYEMTCKCITCTLQLMVAMHRTLACLSFICYSSNSVLVTLLAAETPPFHLSIFGAGYFWDSGLQLKVGALSFSKFCPFLAIARDHSQESNCIELDPSGTGEPVINYVVTKEDEVNLIYALVRCQ